LYPRRDVVGALLWREQRQRIAHGIPKVGAGAGCGLAQDRFEFGEGVLDWIEVRRVWRKVAQARTYTF
jgi:hypothetical protein